MRFLGVSKSLEEIGWDKPDVPLLWRFNQHYFDDLCSFGASSRKEWHINILDDWIQSNPPGQGTGWEPYPTSLRICNWIKWWLASGSSLEIKPVWVQNLTWQVRWLSENLEWHLLGNHLFSNAKALAMAGMFFDGSEAEEWLEKGSKILLRELSEQFLTDGGHFERSPMYHAIAVEDLLDLINGIKTFNLSQLSELREKIEVVLPKALQWLSIMTRPDGSLVRFNDCADDISPSTLELVKYATRLGFAKPAAISAQKNTCVLAQSGYVRISDSKSFIWIDAAPIGPDYLPGHAHADTLSFELVVNGQAVIVNRGTSEYGTGYRRQLERGTSAHNTLSISGKDSSEVWAGFRVGRRARVLERVIREEQDSVRVVASHDGFSHLPGKPVHRRSFHWDSNLSLKIEDSVISSCGGVTRKHKANSILTRFHFAPGFSIKPTVSGFIIQNESVNIMRVYVDEGEPFIESWQHAHGFGDLRQAWTLAVSLPQESMKCHVRFVWCQTSTFSS